MVSVHPCVQSSCIYICVHVKDPIVHVGVQWIMNMLNIQHLLQVGSHDSVAAGFPQGRQPKFPMGEIPLDNTVVKSKVKK